MQWLITGGCGFIGRALATNLLAEDGHSVRVLDNLTTGTRDDLRTVSDFAELSKGSDFSDWSAPLSLLPGDILDTGDIAAAITGAQLVIHLAANTGVPQSVKDPVKDCRTNVNGILNMLEACRTQNIKRFVFSSSGAPLGVQTPPLNEEMAPHPASPYGASKLAGEGYCSAYYHSFGVETVVLRFGNVYGEGSGHKTSVVAKFIKQAMAGEKLEIYGDGSQTRDFIHIEDLIRAIRSAARTPAIGGETFQIATARETTVAEMTEQLLTAMQAEGMDSPEVFYGPTRTGDVARNYSDTSKALDRLAWKPEISLQNGLRQTVRFFMGKNPNPGADNGSLP